MRKRRRRQVVILGFLTAIMLVVAGVTAVTSSIIAEKTNSDLHSQKDMDISQKAGNNEKNSWQQGEMENNEKTEKGEKTLTLRAVGDNLIHGTIYRQAKERGTDGLRYNFEYAYRNIAKMIADADISFINQETLVTDDAFEPSAYPSFNSPPELGDHMIKIGFDLFGLSNNHSYDKGSTGILESIKYWQKRKNVTAVGLYATEEDKDKIEIVEKNGIKIALLAFTEHTNGIPTPKTGSVIKTAETERVLKMVKEAEKLADITIASVHWGVEDSSEVSDSQVEFGKLIVDAGVDLILGTHPHVLQRIETVKTAKNNALCIYSLGNFISAQDYAPNLLGGILDLEMKVKEGTKQVEFTKVKFIPVVTHYGGGYSELRIIPLADYTADLAKKHGVRNSDSRFTFDYLNDRIQKIIGEQYL